MVIGLLIQISKALTKGISLFDITEHLEQLLLLLFAHALA